MGACLAIANSSQPLLSTTEIDGSEKDYHKRFIEDKLLGSGSFGEVKQVFEIGKGDTPYACKALHKGIQFKDNTLYTPIKREALRAECVILRTLNGEHFTVKMVALFESASMLWLVTEFCEGGEMMQYIVKQKSFRTEDVSRVAFQLLDAMNHCHEHGVIHRDLKPENIMFKHSMEGAPLRLIDFGSSCIFEKDRQETVEYQDGVPLVQHSTFAGSAFYISPELFQRTYTYKTDIWSVGVTLYVLVAGFPAAKLQKAFNILHTSQDRDLRHLPGLEGEELPDSFFELLDGLLRYRHKQRKTAHDMLQSEFVQFHKLHTEEAEQALDVMEVAAEAAMQDEGATPAEAKQEAGAKKSRLRRTKSILMMSTVQRHTMYMGYQKFERAVTALLATLLSKEELSSLIDALNKKLESDEESKQLRAVKIHEIEGILTDLGLTRIITTMNKLQGSETYGDFAYRVPLLLDFVRRDEIGESTDLSKPEGTRRSQSTNAAKIPQSVHGNDVFDKWRSARKMNRASSAKNMTSQSAELNFSSHL